VAATALLGLAVAALAALGPLGSGTIRYRVAPLLRDQLVGSDLVSLAVLAPLALLAAVLLARRSTAGALLAPAVALTAWYLVAELVLGPDRSGARPGDDEAWLPLFLLVLLLAAAVAVGAVRRLPAGRVRFDVPTRRLTGGLLILLVGLHVLARYLPAWLGVAAGRAGAEYAAGPGVWWAVAFEDLALLLPAAAVTGVGLLRGSRWAGPAAFAVSGVLALVAAAVTAMAWSTALHGDPGATTATALQMTAVGLLSAAPAAVCWTAWVRSARRDRATAARRPAPARVPVPRSPVPTPEESPC
jgi:hypothetical protein